MIIYEFSLSYKDRESLYNVREIEVEEKTKTYVGNHIRVNKDNINNVVGCYYRMYCLNNDPHVYIQTMIKELELKIKQEEEQLLKLKSRLTQWQSAK